MKSALKRGMGIGMVCAMACGAMLAGLFILPAYVILMTGYSAVLVFLTAGLLYVPSALSKAEMATALPESGGDYVFIDRALGPLVGTISGLGTWLTLVLKTALALAGLGYYLVVISPVFDGYTTLVPLVLTVALVGINVLGITHSGYLQCLLVMLAVGVLGGFVILGLPSLSAAPPEDFFEDGPLGFLSATAFVIVSYAGLTKVVSAAEEIQDPERVIPLGIVLSLVGMTILYTLVVAITLGVVPLEEIGDGPYLNAPIAQPAKILGGYVGELVLSGVAILGLVSMANAGIMAASRYPFAMARYRQFPGFMFHVTPGASTPVYSILVTGGLLVGSLLFLPVMELAKLGSTFLLIVFFLVNAAPIVFREADIEWYQPSYEAPFYPYLQVSGMVACASLIFFMGLFGILSALGLGGVGVLWYWAYVRQHVNRSGVLFRGERHPAFVDYVEGTTRNSIRYASVMVPCFDVREEDRAEVRRRVQLAGILAEPQQDIHVVHLEEEPAEGDGIEEPTEEHRGAGRKFDPLQDILRDGGDIGRSICYQRVRTDRAHEAILSIVNRLHPDKLLLAPPVCSTWGGLGSTDNCWVEFLDSDLIVMDDDFKNSYDTVFALLRPGLNDRLVVDLLKRIEKANGTRITLIIPRSHLDELARPYFDRYLAALEHEPEVVFPPDDNLLEPLQEDQLLVLGNTHIDGTGELPEGAKPEENSRFDVLRLRSRYYRRDGLVETIRGKCGRLPDHLSVSGVRLHEDCRTKGELFDRLAELHARESERCEKSQILEALWNREHLNETYLEDGIAMPHATVEGSQELTVALHVLEEPIRYSPGNDARIIVSLVGSPGHRQQQLYLIRTLMELFLEHDFEIFIREHLDPDVLWAELTGYGPEF